MSEDLAKRIEAVRERVRRNEPHHGDPERFHVEKSEITHELTILASLLRVTLRVTQQGQLSTAELADRQARRARRVTRNGYT